MLTRFVEPAQVRAHVEASDWVGRSRAGCGCVTAVVSFRVGEDDQTLTGNQDADRSAAVAPINGPGLRSLILD